MKKGFVFLIILAVCLSLAFIPSFAERSKSAERTNGAERTKAAERGMTIDPNRTAIHPVVRPTPLQFRAHDVQIGLNTAHSAARFFDAANRAESRDEELAALSMVTRYATEEKLLAAAYERLGDLCAGAPHKQVHSYALAMQYTDSEITRERLRSQIAQLGGDPIAAALTPMTLNTFAAHTAGLDDTCDGAEGVAVPSSETMSISPAGDRNFRAFDVPPGAEAWSVKIETFANELNPYSDSVLWLWAACDGGAPSGLIAHNDDKDFGGGDYMSMIEVSCLLPGTYYIEVGGYSDLVEVLDFDLVVDKTGGCPIPMPDGFEPDDNREQANRIGKPSSIPDHANGWGRANSEIHAHSIFPAFDVDHVKFQPQRSEFVTMTTAFQFPTKFNDFTPIPIGTLADTYIELYYGNEPDYGGFCNDPVSGYTPFCRVDDDCPPPVGPPNPDFDTCVPIYKFTFGGFQVFRPENPLAYNYDIGPGQWGSRLALCLPPSDRWQDVSLSASGGWILRLMSNPIWYPAGMFNYQVQVKNEWQCEFEDEPNNGPFGAKPFEFGKVYYGFQDYSAFFGVQSPPSNDPQGSSWFRTDPDWYSFDVDDSPWPETLVTIETDSFSPYSDTALVLYVGPDDEGFYYDTGIDDDDSGTGFLSKLEFVAIPANDLLGNQVADADYFVDVTSFWLGTNYPYSVSGSTREYVPPLPPVIETEPNSTCETGNPFDISQTVFAEMNPQCDFDAFTFTLTEDTAMVLETYGGDTAMLLENADLVIACDDDSGGGPMWNSIIATCLPPGDYCVRMRPYSSGVAPFAYELNITNLGSCVPTDPPSAIADWAGYGACAYPGDDFDDALGCSNP